MNYVFGINAAVSLALGIALLIVWGRDKQQAFTRDMGWMQIVTTFPTLSFIAYNTGQGFPHVLGMFGIGVGSILLYALGAAALMHLRHRTISSKAMASIIAVLAIYYYWVVSNEYLELWIVSNAAIYMLLGLAALVWLWKLGVAERLIGLGFVLLGLNALLPFAMGVEQGAILQVSIGAVLRVVLCFAFVFAALSRTQQKAQMERERYLQLTERSPQGMLVFDHDHIHFANEAAAKLYGFASPQDLIAAGVYSTEPESIRAEARTAVESVLQGTAVRDTWEGKRFKRDGTPIYVFMHLMRTQWEGKAAIHLTLTDNTAQVQSRQEIRRMEQEREQERIAFAERVKNNLLAANSELERKVAERTRELVAASNAKNQFLANMSHEIRTPMNAVLGMLKLLQGTSLASRQLDYVNKTQGAAQSLLGLLNDILDFSKIDAGKLSLEKLPFEPDRLLRELSVLLSMTASGKDIEVLYDVDPAVPAVLMGDALRLHQVLLNLCANAIKFTTQGEVVLRIRVAEANPQHTRLQFAVADTGIGISEENQQHIFDVFSQADGTTTRRFGGTGLGLSISKRLIALMGGELHLQSTLGQGSTFSFELVLEQAQSLAPTPTAASQVGTPSLAGLQVLVVDDNATARQTLATLAGTLGWQVQVCEGAAQALEAVQQRKQDGMGEFDAVFTDWKMPQTDGWALLQQLKVTAPVAEGPILAMVCNGGRELLNSRSAQEQALLDSFLVKPVTASMLLEAVSEARAGRSNLRDSARAQPATAKRLDGLHILLVEDNALNQLVAQELLRAEGAFVELAENGMLGVEALEKRNGGFDAVLMDMQMPVMDGCTATRLIRKKLKLAELPIIAMTANTMASDREACAKAGMNAHVGKPFDVAYLVEVLLHHTGRQTSDAIQNTSVVPAAPPEATLPSTARPATDAVDTHTAMERIGGDLDLYCQIAQAYLLDIAALPHTLEDLLLARDWTGAARQLHTVKGTSSTVGALYMEAVARQGESALKAQVERFDTAALLADVREAVEHTLQAMGQALRALQPQEPKEP